MGFLARFRRNISDGNVRTSKLRSEIDRDIALGVLLRIVAEADRRVLSEEEREIRAVLVESGDFPAPNIDRIMAAVDEAAAQRVDIFKFAHEVREGLAYEHRVRLLDVLFRVAWSDGELHPDEVETIRRIAGLLLVSNGDFVTAKLQASKSGPRMGKPRWSS